MSFLGKIFGGKKEEKGPTTHEAIQKLRETEELLLKKQEFLERKIETEIQTARKHGTKNKRGIFLLLNSTHLVLSEIGFLLLIRPCFCPY